MRNSFLLVTAAVAVLLASCGDASTTETTSTNSPQQATPAADVSAVAGETTMVNGVEIKIIPGLTAVDVHGNMEKNGFVTEKNIRADISTWISKMSDDNGDFTVTVTGNGPTNITSVDARYAASSAANLETAAAFMQYVSSLRYAGADADGAKAWVGRNANNTSDTIINKVKFRITARDQLSRSLRISVPD